MDIFGRLLGMFSTRAKTLSRYRSGMERSKKKDYVGAIDDYTAVIESNAVPIDVKAMAVYNRSLSYDALDRRDEAAKDLDLMLEMPDLPERIKTQAHQRRERMRRRGG